jgi:Fe-S-cluster-containing dehydrogenase component
MQKRPADGIVFVEPALCVGCKSCLGACPWGAPQWDAESGKVVKCDYCKDRVDAGLKPACVAKCLTHCLDFGLAEDETGRSKRERLARLLAFPSGEGKS